MDDTLWTCVATCQVCGEELNRAEHVPTAQQLKVALGAPLIALCKTTEHNTLSDCNIGVNLRWVREGDGAA